MRIINFHQRALQCMDDCGGGDGKRLAGGESIFNPDYIYTVALYDDYIWVQPDEEALLSTSPIGMPCRIRPASLRHSICQIPNIDADFQHCSVMQSQKIRDQRMRFPRPTFDLGQQVRSLINRRSRWSRVTPTELRLKTMEGGG